MFLFQWSIPMSIFLSVGQIFRKNFISQENFSYCRKKTSLKISFVLNEGVYIFRAIIFIKINNDFYDLLYLSILFYCTK